MGECELCGKEGSRMEANHKELGRIYGATERCRACIEICPQGAICIME